MTTASDSHPNGAGSRQILIDAIEARIARETLTRTGFYGAPVDDGSFLGRLDRQSSTGLWRFRPMRQKRRRNGMDGETIYLKTKQAAALLGLSPRTLESYRCRGGGPAFFRFGGSVRYLRFHVLAWAAARRVRSTSDDGPRREK